MSTQENLSPFIAEFNGVSLRYNKGPEILKDINFSLSPGSFHFMTGESGAGKTSLLSLLYLHLEPTKGRIRLFGQATDMMSRGTKAQIRRQVGVIFQDYRLLNHLNAFDILDQNQDHSFHIFVLILLYKFLLLPLLVS